MDKIQHIKPVLKLCMMTEGKFPTGFPGSKHAHPFHEIGLVADGRCQWTLKRGRRITIEKGQSILIPAGCFHAEEANERVQLAWVGFSLEKDLIRPTPRPVTLGEDFSLVLHLITQIYREQHSSDVNTREICALAIRQVLLLHFRAELHGNLPPKPTSLTNRQLQVARSVAAYFDESTSRPLSLKQVAGYHSLSTQHLSLIFHKHFGITPTAYRLKLRIERARELLKSQMSIKEIAMACGYADTPHFCREYRKATGHPPGSFR